MPNHAIAGRSGNRPAADSTNENSDASGYGSSDVGTSGGYDANQGRWPVIRGIIGGMAVVTQSDVAPQRALFRRGMRLVTAYVRMHPRPFFISVAGSFLFAVSSILLTTALGKATDEVLEPSFTAPVPSRSVWLAVLALMTFGCGRALGIMVRRYYSGVAGERVMASLRNRVADRYRDLQLQYHRETPTGELLAHMEADVKAAVDVFWPVPFATGVIALTVFAMIDLARADPWLALIGLILFPVARPDEPELRAPDGGAGAGRAGGHRRGLRRRARIDRRSPGGRRPWGARTSRPSASRRRRRPSGATGWPAATSGRRSRRGSTPLPTLATALLLAVGSWRVSTGAITTGQLIGFVALFGLLSWPMRFIGWILAELPRAVVGYARLEDVFAEQVIVTPPAEPVAAPAGARSASRSAGVRHLYDGIPVLDGVSFDVAADGDRSRSSGRPASASRRWRSCWSASPTRTKAACCVGGVDVRDADPVALRRDVSIVFQESFLFATTVRENIALEAESSEAEVVRLGDDRLGRSLHPRAAARLRHRGRRARPHAQRAASASAWRSRGPWPGRPRVLILDDATSSVDPTVEADILVGAPPRAVDDADRGGLPPLDDPARRPGRSSWRTASSRRPVRTTSCVGREPGYAAIIHAYERGER